MIAKGLIVFLSGLFIACSPSKKILSSPLAVTSESDSRNELEIIGKNNCFTCHKIEEKLIGPAYLEVANRYDSNDNNIARLTKKIKTGGSGSWGSLPMTSHPTVSNEDAQQMVKYILSLKNK